MKIRSGFVSNSSSSSFIVALSKMRPKDVETLLEYARSEKNIDGWYIFSDEDKGILRGSTIMDNDGLDEFLKESHIDDCDFEYSD
jgi:hypothetical protein